MAQRFKLITTTAAEATSIEYPDRIVTTNLLIRQGDATRILIRDAADTGYRGLLVDDIFPQGSMEFGTNAEHLDAPAGTNQYLIGRAYDTGNANIEIWRMVGAPDPYFQATLPLVFKPIATASLPATPVEGMVTYDGTLNKLVVYNGAAWETVTSAAP